MTLTIVLMSPAGERTEHTNVKHVTDGEDRVRLTFNEEGKEPVEVDGAEIVSVEAHA